MNQILMGNKISLISCHAAPFVVLMDAIKFDVYKLGIKYYYELTFYCSIILHSG